MYFEISKPQLLHEIEFYEGAYGITMIKRRFKQLIKCIDTVFETMTRKCQITYLMLFLEFKQLSSLRAH